MGFVASVCHPSTLRMLIWPEASSAQNSIAAVSAEGSTVCVLILRLNSSCNRSIAFVVRALSGIDGALREREGDAVSEELATAMKRIGELTMENEVLRTRVGHVGPLARGGWREWAP